LAVLLTMPSLDRRVFLQNAVFLVAPHFSGLRHINLALAVLHPILNGFSLTTQVFVSSLLAYRAFQFYFMGAAFQNPYFLALQTMFGFFLTAFLFPPLAIPPPNGPYKVGVIDTYVKMKREHPRHGGNQYLKVRVLYPTQVTTKKEIYLPQGTRICTEFMSFGAPPPLKPMGFLLHYWTLIRSRFNRDAPLISSDRIAQLPTVVYSHGLGATTNLYSVQAGNLASHGWVVFLVEHMDRSCMITHDHNGNEVPYDKSVVKLRDGDKDTPEYVRARRGQCDIRCHEVAELTRYVVDVVATGGEGIDPKLKPFAGRLMCHDGKVHLMGHSMGGATSLNACGRFPDLFRSVVVHDPAVDWVADDVRKDLLKLTSHTGLGGFLDDKSISGGLGKVPLSFVYCDHWKQLGWGFSAVIEEQVKKNRVGLKGKSDINFLSEGTTHHEFSDNSLIVPLWLGKLIKNSGPDPDNSALFITELAMSFFDKADGLARV